MSRTLNILGVTGSIGQSTMDVVLSDPSLFTVNVISAHNNVEGLATAAKKLKAKKAVVTNPEKYTALQNLLQGSGIKAETDLENALLEKVDITMAAIVGVACLRPVLASAMHGGVLALASKEPVVAAGPLLLEAAKQYSTKILPVDSEHNAVFQVSEGQDKNAIERIILTASGGPFRTWSAGQIAQATVKQALAHPTWSMGTKISIDSATMMNKALEIIEAHYLFNMHASQIEVLIHPQSIVHSMVEYSDGSILAQMGASDMRTPIAHALAWPHRMKTPGQRLDFKTLKTLEFEQPDYDRFPALRLAYECLEAGPSHCIALNGANEIAVEAFLCGQIRFPDIITTIEYVLGETAAEAPSLLKRIEEIDALSRQSARGFINTILTTQTKAV